MPIIRCENVTKTYVTGDVRVEALRGITMDIERGRWSPLWGRPDAVRLRC